MTRNLRLLGGAPVLLFAVLWCCGLAVAQQASSPEATAMLRRREPRSALS